MKPNLNLWCIILITFAGCNYDITEHYVNPIEPPATEQIVIRLTAENDTITITESTAFQFSLSTIHRHAATEIYFNNNKIHTLPAGIETFSLNVDPYHTGYFPLDIRVITDPETGSLADIEGSDPITTWRSFVVFVDKILPKESPITAIGPEDGTLRVRWKGSEDPLFEYYEIRKYTINRYSGHYEISDTLTVTDQGKHYVDDVAFIGGTARYRLRVVARGRFSEPSEVEYISLWKPDLNFTWRDETHAEFTWRRNPYYNNIDAFGFSQAGKPGETITDHTDTVAVFTDLDFDFGKSLEVQLKIVSKADPTRYQTFSKTLHKGTPCHKYFYYAEFNPSLGEYFALKYSSDWRIPDSLFVFGEDKLHPVRVQQLDKEALNMSFSPDGTLVYILYEDELVAYDAVSFETVQHYSFASLPDGFRKAYSSKLVITENNLALIEFWHFAVIDLNTMSVVFSSTSGAILTIAPDGSQLFVLNERFLWNGTTFVDTDQAFFPLSTYIWDVTQHSADTLTVSEETYFSVIHAQTGDVLKNISFGDSWSQYDHRNEMLYVFINGTVECRNLESGITQTISINTANAPISQTNKHLICLKGFYIQVD